MLQFPGLIARELLMCLLKSIPFDSVSRVLDFCNNIAQSNQARQQQQRLAQIEDRLEEQDYLFSKVLNLLEGLQNPMMGSEQMDLAIESMREMKEDHPMPLFEGMFDSHPRWNHLKSDPGFYGARVLGTGERINPHNFQILLHLDQIRVLEISPYLFGQLFGDYTLVRTRPQITATADIWAVPGGLKSHHGRQEVLNVSLRYEDLSDELVREQTLRWIAQKQPCLFCGRTGVPLARCLKRDCFAVSCRQCIKTKDGLLKKSSSCSRCGTRWPTEHDIAWFRPGGDLLELLMKQLVAAGSRPVMSES